MQVEGKGKGSSQPSLNMSTVQSRRPAFQPPDTPCIAVPVKGRRQDYLDCDSPHNSLQPHKVKLSAF